MSTANLAIVLLLIGAFGCGLHGAVKSEIVPTAVGVILLTIAVLITVVGH